MNDLSNIHQDSQPEFAHGRIMPIPGYYLIKRDHKEQYHRDKGFVTGELVYVIPGATSVHVLIGESTWTYAEDEIGQFYDDFEYDPEGSTKRQTEVSQLMQDVITEGHYSSVSHQLLDFNPHVEDDNKASDSTGLMTIGGGMSMVDAKRNIAETRNMVLRSQRDMRLKTERLELLLSEQTRALSIKAEELKGMLKKAEEIIWTINLYLGKNEEIHKLVEGEPAPADEKIAIRQSVLFMDEECALLARDGGIDAESVNKFDEWLAADKAHIQQIIPESKGIVALHIKRYKKEYNDPWVDASLNQANIHWTYFLIRNGENLYRVFVDIVIGANLFPTEHEYNELFMTTETDYDTPGNPRVTKFLKPGSEKYMKAMEKADAKHRHYLRVVLILQGLLDRTPIFKPMPVERINICNLNACEEYLRLIYDKENVLGDGRPYFWEWQKSINSQLDVGHRIIGIFDYSSGLRKTRDYEESRIYPSTARYPDSLKLHTIEKRDERLEGKSLVILYERTGDIVYSRSRWDHNHEATTRARCVIYRSDRFILNFDAASIDDMEYYLNSRKSKCDYNNMVPVLEIAIKLKKAEIAEETPFRLLLIGSIMKCYKASHDEAEARVDELIKWWKFKNRTHRALTSEDAKALKMIVDEFGLRLKQESVRNRTATFNDVIINSILEANDQDVIMIAHKAGNKYTAYVAHNKSNIWVREQIWSHNRVTGDITMVENKEWKLVDKRYMRWDIIHKTDRWESWKINPQMSQVITDDEINIGVQTIINHLTKNDDENDEDSDSTKRFLPLCAYYDDSFKIFMWYSSKGPVIPNELILSNHHDAPNLCRITATFERKKDGVSFRVTYPSVYSYRPSDLPWFINDDKETKNNIIKVWTENTKQVTDEFAQCAELNEKIYDLKNKYNYVISAVSQHIYDEKVVAARKEFDSEYGDPELWDDHLKSLKIEKQRYNHVLKEALHLLAERNIDIVGWTIEQVLQKAIEFGLFDNDHDTRFRVRGGVHLYKEDNEIPSDIPLELVVPEPPKPEKDDNDDDSDDEDDN